MKPEILSQRLWTAAQYDPALLAELQGAYRGSFDVRDALWWRAHPLAPTPTGRPDPAIELEALKAAVYSPQTAQYPLVEFVDPITLRTVHATDSEHRLRRLMRAQAEEDAALDDVLARVGDPGGHAALTRDSDDTGAPVAAGDHVPADISDATMAANEGRHSAGERRRPALLFAAGAIVGALAILGAESVAGRIGAGTTAPMAAVTRAPTAPETTQPPAQDVLQVFAQPADFPGDNVPDLGAGYARNTIRSIGASPAERGYGVYVARRGAAQYCIVVRNVDNTGADSCASRHTIAMEGLRVNATVRGTIAVSGNPRMPVVLNVYVAWAPNGSITTTSVPYTAGCTAPEDC